MSEIFVTSAISASLVLSMMGLLFTAAIPGIDRWNKRFFLNYFFVLMACCLFSLVDCLLFDKPVPHAAVFFIMVLECLFISLPLPMLTVYLLHSCNEDMRQSKLLYTVLGLWVVSVVLLVSAPLTGVFSYVELDNYYYRGPLYPLYLLPMVAILLLNLVGVLQRKEQLSHKAFPSLLIAILPMTAALLVQMFVDVLPLFDISFVISALSMYGLILSDQIEQELHRQREIARQQQEIANQRASIMVLQMRPHFIYNTMMSIYSLCNQDSQKARQVIKDFTDYLRKNFTAVASETPIPFSSELEHTRAYLAVEKAQYEDSLFVDYDTPHTMFRVPPLTLQPIVENAVKHGRDPYAGPFHISIRTRKTDSGSEIVVADNGKGFESAGDGEEGLALKNIRQRLEIMCGGEMTITPNNGGGTVVTVTIPDSAAQ